MKKGRPIRLISLQSESVRCRVLSARTEQTRRMNGGDPTGTRLLRSAYERALIAPVESFAEWLKEQVKEKDVFGLEGRKRTIGELTANYSPDQPRDEQGKWTDGRGGGGPARAGGGEKPKPFASAPDDPSLYGRTSAQLNSMGVKQKSGAPIRGKPMPPDDPRIPETVYHMTTALDKVESSGVLRAAGEGGLGGDAQDQIVSLTFDRKIAEDLASDMRLTIGAMDKAGKVPGREWSKEKMEWVGDRTEWGRKYTAELAKDAERRGFKWEVKGDTPGEKLQLESYGVSDWNTQYFTRRETARIAKDPLLYGPEKLRGMDPAKIGIVEVPKAALRTGALVTDFDLDNPFGLREVRVYGDVPLPKGAAFKALAERRQYEFVEDPDVSIDLLLGEWKRKGVSARAQVDSSRAFLDSSYKKGIRAAWREVADEDEGMASTEKGLAHTMSGPVAVKRLSTIHQRQYSLLGGIDNEMEAQARKVLARGLLEGRGADDIAASLEKALDIPRNRARTIARTEVVHAHAEGALDAFRQAGYEGVTALAEWSTADDGHVCGECEPMEGRVFTLEEARGMIPRHPNCRCSWVPVVEGEEVEAEEEGRRDAAFGLAPGELPQWYAQEDAATDEYREARREERERKHRPVREGTIPGTAGDIPPCPVDYLVNSAGIPVAAFLLNAKRTTGKTRDGKPCMTEGDTRHAQKAKESCNAATAYEHKISKQNEQWVAKLLGQNSQSYPDNEPWDVVVGVPRGWQLGKPITGEKTKEHPRFLLEMKSNIISTKAVPGPGVKSHDTVQVTMHKDAQWRKVTDAKRLGVPEERYFSVVVDVRDCPGDDIAHPNARAYVRERVGKFYVQSAHPIGHPRNLYKYFASKNGEKNLEELFEGPKEWEKFAGGRR